MAAAVLTEFKQRIKALRLVPAGGGCFELTANGKLLHSKLKTGVFPDEGDILQMLDAV